MALFLVALILTASAFIADSARGQSGPVRPSAEGVLSTPIGKVVSAKGPVTVEHVNAVIVQAKVAAGGGQTKVGDFVCMVLNEFVFDPKGTSNSTLFSLSKGTFTFIAGKVS